MLMSLESQLRAHRLKFGAEGKSHKKGTLTLLTKQAATTSLDDVLEEAERCAERLLLIDSSLSSVITDLADIAKWGRTSHGAIRLSFLSDKERRRLHVVVTQLLCRLGDLWITSEGLGLLEYLMQAFEIHRTHRHLLLTLAAPFFSNALFVRLLLCLGDVDKTDNTISWVLDVQKTGIPLSEPDFMKLLRKTPGLYKLILTRCLDIVFGGPKGKVIEEEKETAKAKIETEDEETADVETGDKVVYTRHSRVYRAFLLRLVTGYLPDITHFDPKKRNSWLLSMQQLVTRVARLIADVSLAEEDSFTIQLKMFLNRLVETLGTSLSSQYNLPTLFVNSLCLQLVHSRLAQRKGVAVSAKSTDTKTLAAIVSAVLSGQIRPVEKFFAAQSLKDEVTTEGVAILSRKLLTSLAPHVVSLIPLLPSNVGACLVISHIYWAAVTRAESNQQSVDQALAEQVEAAVLAAACTRTEDVIHSLLSLAGVFYTHRCECPLSCTCARPSICKLIENALAKFLKDKRHSRATFLQLLAHAHRKPVSYMALDMLSSEGVSEEDQLLLLPEDLRSFATDRDSARTSSSSRLLGQIRRSAHQAAPGLDALLVEQVKSLTLRDLKIALNETKGVVREALLQETCTRVCSSLFGSEHFSVQDSLAHVKTRAGGSVTSLHGAVAAAIQSDAALQHLVEVMRKENAFVKDKPLSCLLADGENQASLVTECLTSEASFAPSSLLCVLTAVDACEVKLPLEVALRLARSEAVQVCTKLFQPIKALTTSLLTSTKAEDLALAVSLDSKCVDKLAALSAPLRLSIALELCISEQTLPREDLNRIVKSLVKSSQPESGLFRLAVVGRDLLEVSVFGKVMKSASTVNAWVLDSLKKRDLLASLLAGDYDDKYESKVFAAFQSLALSAGQRVNVVACAEPSSMFVRLCSPADWMATKDTELAKSTMNRLAKALTNTAPAACMMALKNVAQSKLCPITENAARAIVAVFSKTKSTQPTSVVDTEEAGADMHTVEGSKSVTVTFEGWEGLTWLVQDAPSVHTEMAASSRFLLALCAVAERGFLVQDHLTLTSAILSQATLAKHSDLLIALVTGPLAGDLESTVLATLSKCVEKCVKSSEPLVAFSLLGLAKSHCGVKIASSVIEALAKNLAPLMGTPAAIAAVRLHGERVCKPAHWDALLTAAFEDLDLSVKLSKSLGKYLKAVRKEFESITGTNQFFVIANRPDEAALKKVPEEKSLDAEWTPVKQKLSSRLSHLSAAAPLRMAETLKSLFTVWISKSTECSGKESKFQILDQRRLMQCVTAHAKHHAVSIVNAVYSLLPSVIEEGKTEHRADVSSLCLILLRDVAEHVVQVPASISRQTPLTLNSDGVSETENTFCTVSQCVAKTMSAPSSTNVMKKVAADVFAHLYETTSPLNLPAFYASSLAKKLDSEQTILATSFFTCLAERLENEALNSPTDFVYVASGTKKESTLTQLIALTPAETLREFFRTELKAWKHRPVDLIDAETSWLTLMAVYSQDAVIILEIWLPALASRCTKHWTRALGDAFSVTALSVDSAAMLPWADSITAIIQKCVAGESVSVYSQLAYGLAVGGTLMQADDTDTQAKLLDQLVWSRASAIQAQASLAEFWTEVKGYWTKMSEKRIVKVKRQLARKLLYTLTHQNDTAETGTPATDTPATSMAEPTDETTVTKKESTPNLSLQELFAVCVGVLIKEGGEKRMIGLFSSHLRDALRSFRSGSAETYSDVGEALHSFGFALSTMDAAGVYPFADQLALVPTHIATLLAAMNTDGESSSETEEASVIAKDSSLLRDVWSQEIFAPARLRRENEGDLGYLFKILGDVQSCTKKNTLEVALNAYVQALIAKMNGKQLNMMFTSILHGCRCGRDLLLAGEEKVTLKEAMCARAFCCVLRATAREWGALGVLGIFRQVEDDLCEALKRCIQSMMEVQFVKKRRGPSASALSDAVNSESVWYETAMWCLSALCECAHALTQDVADKDVLGESVSVSSDLMDALCLAIDVMAAMPRLPAQPAYVQPNCTQYTHANAWLLLMRNTFLNVLHLSIDDAALLSFAYNRLLEKMTLSDDIKVKVTVVRILKQAWTDFTLALLPTLSDTIKMLVEACDSADPELVSLAKSWALTIEKATGESLASRLTF